MKQTQAYVTAHTFSGTTCVLSQDRLIAVYPRITTEQESRMATQSKLEKQASKAGWDKASWIAGYVASMVDDYFATNPTDAKARKFAEGRYEQLYGGK